MTTSGDAGRQQVSELAVVHFREAAPQQKLETKRKK